MTTPDPLPAIRYCATSGRPVQHCPYKHECPTGPPPPDAEHNDLATLRAKHAEAHAAYRDQLDALVAVRDRLDARVAALTAERDRLRAVVWEVQCSGHTSPCPRQYTNPDGSTVYGYMPCRCEYDEAVAALDGWQWSHTRGWYRDG